MKQDTHGVLQNIKKFFMCLNGRILMFQNFFGWTFLISELDVSQFCSYGLTTGHLRSSTKRKKKKKTGRRNYFMNFSK